MKEDIIFFPSPTRLEEWMEVNHASASELWVGFHKVNSGEPSITWPESVKVALCFGWIDGLRKSIDESSYKIRFTPRRKDSIWSKKNIEYIHELKKAGKIRPSGLLAYQSRKEEKSGIYSFEQTAEIVLDPSKITAFKKSPEAWKNFNAMAEYYKRTAIHWVMSAKQETTREKRLNTLIECSFENLKIPSQRR